MRAADVAAQAGGVIARCPECSAVVPVRQRSVAAAGMRPGGVQLYELVPAADCPAHGELRLPAVQSWRVRDGAA